MLTPQQLKRLQFAVGLTMLFTSQFYVVAKADLPRMFSILMCQTEEQGGLATGGWREIHDPLKNDCGPGRCSTRSSGLLSPHDCAEDFFRERFMCHLPDGHTEFTWFSDEFQSFHRGFEVSG